VEANVEQVGRPQVPQQDGQEKPLSNPLVPRLLQPRVPDLFVGPPFVKMREGVAGQDFADLCPKF
jgi:hypothetical protein